MFASLHGFDGHPRPSGHEIPLFRLIQNVGFRYALSRNCKEGWTGHLFQGQGINRMRKPAETNPRVNRELERLQEEMAQMQICQA